MNRTSGNTKIIGAAREQFYKIAELWDFGQAVPENMINENGMF